MKQVWTDTELNAHWNLSDDDCKFLKSHTGLGRLALALQLKYYQLYAAFPKQLTDIAPDVLEYICFQSETFVNDLSHYNCNSRTGRQHRRNILSHLAVRAFDTSAATRFKQWLIETILPTAPEPPYQDQLITEWFLDNRCERPGNYRLARLIKSAEHLFEKQVFQQICRCLSKHNLAQLDNILEDKEGMTAFSWLCTDMGPVSLESVLRAIDQLEALRQLTIPAGILQGIHPKLIKRYRERARTENAWELRRHPASIRYPLLTFYCVPREAEITDRLVELLIQVIHKISARAERKIVSELINSVTKVQGKTTLLFRIAEAVFEDPDSAVRDVVFPVVNEQTIERNRPKIHVLPLFQLI